MPPLQSAVPRTEDIWLGEVGIQLAGASGGAQTRPVLALCSFFPLKGIKLIAIKVFPHLPTDAFCRDRLLCASSCASFALGVPLPSLGWGEEGLEVSEGSLVFLQKIHKSHFSFPSVSCVPMSSAVRDQNTLCIRSQLPPDQFVCRSATLSCPQDTSHLSFHSVYFGCCYFFGYRRKRGGLCGRKQPLAGAAGETGGAELCPLFCWTVFL